MRGVVVVVAAGVVVAGCVRWSCTVGSAAPAAETPVPPAVSP